MAAWKCVHIKLFIALNKSEQTFCVVLFQQNSRPRSRRKAGGHRKLTCSVFFVSVSAGAVAAVLEDALLEERRELADGVFGEVETSVGSERRARG